jgi:large subunit ribosomal protein L21
VRNGKPRDSGIPSLVKARPTIYAIIETGGKQYRVTEGQTIAVERLEIEEGASIELDRVLLIGEGENVTVGRPVVDGARVLAVCEENGRGDKIIVFKYKPKVRYRRKNGHRQEYTALNIEKILAPGEAAPKVKATRKRATKAETAEAAAEAPATAEATAAETATTAETEKKAAAPKAAPKSTTKSTAKAAPKSTAKATSKATGKAAAPKAAAPKTAKPKAAPKKATAAKPKAEKKTAAAAPKPAKKAAPRKKKETTEDGA